MDVRCQELTEDVTLLADEKSKLVDQSARDESLALRVTTLERDLAKSQVRVTELEKVLYLQQFFRGFCILIRAYPIGRF
ncbi:unnamed protein product [Protopolystoma xenopodis]|uniref:Uncharacterized protein n=1 Tax=Protopolystoma xenopodis TaxID=117903 RepID=A0A3S5CPZ1_9PLAT|nr:unnamed protein product [Protopolystoma xenopodis]